MLTNENLTQEERITLSSCLRLLGSLFYLAPNHSDLVPFFSILKNNLLITEWPFGDKEALARIEGNMLASLADSTAIKEAHQRLFIGPDSFEAPAWGSVYLDKESVLFGDSTLELRAFLSSIAITLNTGLNEPEDHIGLMLWLASELIGAGKDAEFKELLEIHLLPWSNRYLELLAEHAGHSFYEGLAELTQITLTELVSTMQLTSISKRLYR